MRNVVDVRGAHITAESAATTPRSGDGAASSQGGNANARPNPFERAGSIVEAPPIQLPNQRSAVSHFAIDIGGTLAKIVYFSNKHATTHKRTGPAEEAGGRLHFVKFETRNIQACIDFIKSKNLHLVDSSGSSGREGSEDIEVVVQATGGGAHKYADLFKQQLGLRLEKIDEMSCVVSGANFLLRAIRDEAFTYANKKKTYVPWTHASQALFPYLLVNIGSGVSMIKVTGDGEHERISGSSLGGGAFWGLARLLTGCSTFDELLELCKLGDNSKVDMLVGDIYGGKDYSSIGLSAQTIASSFGKVVMEGGKLEDYKPEDLAVSLLRMVAYNIGQIAYLNALRHGLERVFFGGYFIRGQTFTMETIGFAIDFWSKGSMKAMFLRHEGFLGALGAFVSGSALPYLNKQDVAVGQLAYPPFWVERFPIGAALIGGVVRGPPIQSLDEKLSWVERFIKLSSEEDKASSSRRMSGSNLTELGKGASELPKGDSEIEDLSNEDEVLGVLHLNCSYVSFPLLKDALSYEPNTAELQEASELEYWVEVLLDSLPRLQHLAAESEENCEDATRRAEAFGTAFRAHLQRLKSEPHSYGRLGLADLLELREECLREFHFMDVYRHMKESENSTALEVLPDLLRFLDDLEPSARFLAVIEGVLAGNIFDWGAKSCVELYQNGTILEIYQQARHDKLANRPWRVDNFDQLQRKWLNDATVSQAHGLALTEEAVKGGYRTAPPYRKALFFVDNSGADIVLGILPMAREFLRRGIKVVLAANTLPALNDVTAAELTFIVAAASSQCCILRKASEAEEPMLTVVATGNGGPCIDLRRVSQELGDAAKGVDLVVLEGMGRAIHTNYFAKFTCDALKLAMIKNKRLAQTLFDGDAFDGVCRFEPFASDC